MRKKIGSDVPFSEYCPIGQADARALGVGHEKPAGHSSQYDMLYRLYVPDGQLTGATDGSAHDIPSGHGSQVMLPPVEYPHRHGYGGVSW